MAGFISDSTVHFPVRRYGAQYVQTPSPGPPVGFLVCPRKVWDTHIGEVLMKVIYNTSNRRTTPRG